MAIGIVSTFQDLSFFSTEIEDGSFTPLTTKRNFDSVLSPDCGHANTFGTQDMYSKHNNATPGLVGNLAHVAAHLRLAAACIESTA